MVTAGDMSKLQLPADDSVTLRVTHSNLASFASDIRVPQQVRTTNPTSHLAWISSQAWISSLMAPGVGGFALLLDHRGGAEGEAVEEDGHGRGLHAAGAPRRGRRQGRRPRPRRRAPRHLLPLRRVRPSVRPPPASPLANYWYLSTAAVGLMVVCSEGTGCTSSTSIPRR